MCTSSLLALEGKTCPGRSASTVGYRGAGWEAGGLEPGGILACLELNFKSLWKHYDQLCVIFCLSLWRWGWNQGPCSSQAHMLPSPVCAVWLRSHFYISLGLPTHNWLRIHYQLYWVPYRIVLGSPAVCHSQSLQFPMRRGNWHFQSLLEEHTSSVALRWLQFSTVPLGLFNYELLLA